MPKPRVILSDVKDAYARSDARVARVLARGAEEGVRVSCGRGCSGCCHNLMAVPPVEAVALVVAVKVAGRLDELRHRLVESEVMLRECEEAQPGAPHEAWFTRGIPCPLLRGTTCSVYEVRPMGCRMWWVTSPAALCSPSAGIQRVQHIDMQRPALALAAELQEIGERRGLPGGLDHLPRQLLRAVEWLESRRWPEGVSGWWAKQAGTARVLAAGAERASAGP